MAHRAQDAHECRHLQIVEQSAPDHLKHIFRDIEYWIMFSCQERIKTRLLNEELGIIRKVEQGSISIIDCEN